MKHKLYILCALLLMAGLLSGCAEDSAVMTMTPVQDSAAPAESERTADEIYTTGGSDDRTTAGETQLDEDGAYSEAADVALYLHTYGGLPDNFITKSEARDLGWSGGGLEDYAPGKCIGGDAFGNREGLLPEGTYHECDVNTLGSDSRGAERIVWDEDGNIYYTGDHYESFELIYAAE